MRVQTRVQLLGKPDAHGKKPEVCTYSIRSAGVRQKGIFARNLRSINRKHISLKCFEFKIFKINFCRSWIKRFIILLTIGAFLQKVGADMGEEYFSKYECGDRGKPEKTRDVNPGHDFGDFIILAPVTSIITG